MAELAKKRVLIAEPITGSEQTYDLFKNLGWDLVVGPSVSYPDRGYTEEELIRFGNEFDGIIGMSREKFPRRVLEASKRLKIYSKYGIGVDHVDVKAATENGIIVSRATGINSVSVAEYTISLMLGLLKKLNQNDKNIRNGGWRNESCIGFELNNKTVGLVGFGAIARQVAKRLQGWEVKIVAFDPYVSPETANQFGATMVDWETLFTSADIISLHTPLTEETKGMVGEKEFNMMKSTALLINTTRGKTIDEQALIKALQAETISGAGLDVFDKEPVNADNPLLSMNNVILAPHIAGWTYEALGGIAMQAARNCIQALSGEKPDFIVNPEVLESSAYRSKR